MPQKIIAILFFITSLELFGFSLGVHGGLNFSGASSKSSLGVSQALNGNTYFIGGGLAELEMNSLMYLRLEGNYVKRGSSDATSTLNLDYIELPVSLVFRIDLPLIKPYVLAGIQYGILSKATTKVQSSGFTIDATGIKSSDIGINVGIGADLTLAPLVALELELRMYRGITDINESSAEYKNNSVMGLLGIVFGI